MFAKLIFSIVDFSARKGLSATDPGESVGDSAVPAKQRALRTGVRGETYAYWYLRRHGYVLVARNFTSPGLKGEIDMVGYDGAVLAFVEVKTRTKIETSEKFAALQATPESAVNLEKRRNISRVAQQFLRARHIESAECRFDVLAIETQAGQRPLVRLHKGAFNAGEQRSRQV
jgi:putative endonuclease